MARDHRQRGGTASNVFIENFGIDWHSTAAIASILLFPTAGNFVAGSTFTLYGEA